MTEIVRALPPVRPRAPAIVIAGGVQPSLRTVLSSMGFDGSQPSLQFADSVEAALFSIRQTP